MTHVSLLPNRNPVESLRSQHRVDPFWDGLWSASSASWWQRDSIERMAQAGLVSGSLWARPLPRAEALEAAFLSSRLPGPRVAAVAAANLWRTLTFEQLAAITGRTQHAGAASRDVHLLYSAGLVDVGKATLPGVSSRVPLMVRPNSKGDWAQLENVLSFDDWIGVTSGQDWRWGTQAERHNALVTELCLRAAEFTPVPLVLGEHLCALKVLRPDGVQLSPHQANLAGDGMLVRSDGLRIMVELTVSTARIDEKVRRWADMLAADRTRSLVVVFVHAPHPDKPVPGQWKAVRKAVWEAGRASMSHVLADVPGRLMVASWTDWFPARHVVSDDFLRLRCWRGTGSGDGDEDRWAAADCLDPFDVSGPVGGDPKAVLRHAGWLLGVPHWLRPKGAGSPLKVWARVERVGRLPRQQGVPLPPQERARRAARRAA